MNWATRLLRGDKTPWRSRRGRRRSGSGQQRALEGGDREAPVLRARDRDRREALGEGLLIIPDFNDFRLNRGEIRDVPSSPRRSAIFGLILQGFAVAAPMLLELQAGVENHGACAD